MSRPPRQSGKTSSQPDEPEATISTSRASKGQIDPAYHFFSNALRTARLNRGMTQLELAAKAKVALGTVHLAETARQNPTLKSLTILAEGVGLKIGDLLPQTISEAEEKRRLEIAAQIDAELELVRAELKNATTILERLTALIRLLRTEQGGPPLSS